MNQQTDSATQDAPRRRVLVTGAAGTIGRAVRRHLIEDYTFRNLDLVPTEGDSVVADVSDLDAIQPAFEGIDAVVHLAATISVHSPWEDVLPANIVGTYNVFEAAKRAGVKCVVFASSNHTVGGYESDGAPSIYALDDPRVIDINVPLRPDSYYGVSKVFGEALGRYYSDTFGLRVLCLRIGTVRPDDDPLAPEIATSSSWLPLTPEQGYERLRATWLSQRDCAHLIGQCIEAEHVPYGIYYGISNNLRRMWEIESAKSDLGYDPQDQAPK